MFEPTEPINPSNTDHLKDLSLEKSPTDAEEIEPIAKSMNELQTTIAKLDDKAKSILPTFYTALLSSDLLLSMVDYFIVDKTEKSFDFYSNIIGSIAKQLPIETSPSLDSIKPFNIEERLNTTQNAINALLMLSYKNVSPNFQLSIITKTFAKLCRTYINQLHKNPHSSITDTQFLELSKILSSELYQNDFKKIPVLTYVISTNNIQFIDTLCMLLLEVLYVQNLYSSNVGKNKSGLVNLKFKSSYDTFIKECIRLLEVTLEQCNGIFMHWILKNMFTFEMHYLTEYLYKTKDSKKLQKFSADILYSYTSHILNSHAADNSETTKPDSNNLVFIDSGKHVFQRIRNTIITLNFRIMYVNSCHNPVIPEATCKNINYKYHAKYVILNSFADCKKAVDFIFSLPSDVYTSEQKLEDILLTFITYSDDMRKDLIEYAIRSYQSLPQSLPLHQFIDFDILDIVLLIYMNIGRQYEKSRVLFYSNIVNEYFNIKNLNNHTEQILKTIIFAATYESECGKLFLRDNRLLIWFENNYTIYHSNLYFIAATTSGLFTVVSTFLDLQRQKNLFTIEWRRYIYALQIALKKNHVIICKLLLDSIEFYFHGHVSTSISIEESEARTLYLIIDAINLDKYEFVDIMIKFINTHKTHFNKEPIHNLILLSAYNQPEPKVIFYFLDKFRDRMDFLINKFKDVPLIQLIFKLHKFLVKEPSIFNPTSLFDHNELKECLELLISVLNNVDIEATVIPYLNALFTDRFKIVKQNLDRFVQSLLLNKQIRNDISFTYLFLKIIANKYPALAKEYQHKFPELNAEKMQTHLNESHYVRLKRLMPFLLQVNSQEQIDRLIYLLPQFNSSSNHEISEYKAVDKFEIYEWFENKFNKISARINALSELDREYLDQLKERLHCCFKKAYQHDAHGLDLEALNLPTNINGDVLEMIIEFTWEKRSTIAPAAEPESSTASDTDTDSSDQELHYSNKLKR